MGNLLYYPAVFVPSRHSVTTTHSFQLLSASSGINLSGNLISTASYQNQTVFQTILGDSACPLDLVYWEVNVSKAQEYKIGISHRFMKPGKGR